MKAIRVSTIINPRIGHAVSAVGPDDSIKARTGYVFVVFADGKANEMACSDLKATRTGKRLDDAVAYQLEGYHAMIARRKA